MPEKFILAATMTLLLSLSMQLNPSAPKVVSQPEPYRFDLAQERFAFLDLDQADQQLRRLFGW